MNNDRKIKRNKSYRFDDDNRTIADMNVKGFRWYIDEKNKHQHKELISLNIKKEEHRAMVKGAWEAIFPIVFAVIGIFLIIFLIIFAWLN